MDQDDDASVKDQDDDAPVKDQDDDGENEEGKKETSVSTQKTVSDEATTSKKPVSLSPNVSAITAPRQEFPALPKAERYSAYQAQYAAMGAIHFLIFVLVIISLLIA